MSHTEFANLKVQSGFSSKRQMAGPKLPAASFPAADSNGTAATATHFKLGKYRFSEIGGILPRMVP